MCKQLPFLETDEGMGSLVKSVIVALFLLCNDGMTPNEKNEVLEMASVSGSDAHVPQSMPPRILQRNRESAVQTAPKADLINEHGQYVPYVVKLADDTLHGRLTTKACPYVVTPPEGMEPFPDAAAVAAAKKKNRGRSAGGNSSSTRSRGSSSGDGDSDQQDAAVAALELPPLLIVVVVGGLGYNELQEFEKLAARSGRPVMCVSTSMTTVSGFLSDLFSS
jgi:hypothetical protein